MTLLTTHPVLDSRTAINYYVQNDSALAAEFSFTNANTKATEYRIYTNPLNFEAIKGNSFATYFLGEAPFNQDLGVRIPKLYSEIIYQGSIVELSALIDRCWLTTQTIIELLRSYPSLHYNNRATCGLDYITDIEPIAPPEKLASGSWVYGLTFTHEIFPLGVQP